MTTQPSMLARIVPFVVLFGGIAGAFLLGATTKHSAVRPAPPKIVYRTAAPATDPAAHDTRAGLVAALRETWDAQDTVENRTARYPVWLLGYRIESYGPTKAIVDDFTTTVNTGGKTASYGLLQIPFRWNGTRWVQGQVSQVEGLGNTPADYAQFTPLP